MDIKFENRAHSASITDPVPVTPDEAANGARATPALAAFGTLGVT